MRVMKALVTMDDKALRPRYARMGFPLPLITYPNGEPLSYEGIIPAF